MHPFEDISFSFSLSTCLGTWMCLCVLNEWYGFLIWSFSWRASCQKSDTLDSFRHHSRMQLYCYVQFNYFSCISVHIELLDIHFQLLSLYLCNLYVLHYQSIHCLQLNKPRFSSGLQCVVMIFAPALVFEEISDTSEECLVELATENVFPVDKILHTRVHEC